ncbi:MAG TPA: IclR family transcriptional regulator [Bacillota bacterium]|nr:IclR family transcriptional regulator [Bacillota bacterium]
MKENDTQVNSAIDRALLILELISKQGHGLTLADLSKVLDIPKSTIHRILETLKQRGFIELSPGTDKYVVGLKALEIGFTGLRNVEIVDVAIHYLRDLSESTGETAFLAIYNEGEIVYLYKVEGTQSIRTTAQLGSRRPVHATGLGKAILSEFSLHEVDMILEAKGLEKYTDHTITDLHSFHEELSRIRVQGYAVDKEEIEIGLTCYAVPVLGYTGKVMGGISLAGPTQRVVEKQEEFTKRLKEAASQISRRLGFVPSMR